MSDATPPNDGNSAPPPPPSGGGSTPPPPPPPPAYGQTPAPGTAPDGRQYAEWIWRVLAYLIDYIPAAIIAGIGWFCTIIFTSTSEVTREGTFYGTPYSYTSTETSVSAIGLILAVIFYLIALVYWFWNKGVREGTTGKSIGKQVTGYTTLHEETNQPIGAGMGCLRLLLLWVDFLICYIGVLWPLWDPKRQCLLSDRLTKAVVYKD